MLKHFIIYYKHGSDEIIIESTYISISTVLFVSRISYDRLNFAWKCRSISKELSLCLELVHFGISIDIVCVGNIRYLLSITDLLPRELYACWCWMIFKWILPVAWVESLSHFYTLVIRLLLATIFIFYWHHYYF